MPSATTARAGRIVAVPRPTITTAAAFHCFTSASPTIIQRTPATIVRRAKEHRDAIDNDLRATFDVLDNLPRVGTKYEPESGDHVLYVTHVPHVGDLLERTSLRFGDAVHNLRSALDHCVFDLALRYTNGNVQRPRQIEFPITDSSDLWNQRLYRLSEVDPTDVAVLKWYQPYEALARAGQPVGSRTQLGMLRDLDDWDKHRLLTAVAVPDAGLTNPHPQALAIWMPMFMERVASSDPIPLTEIELGTVLARAQFPDSVRLMDMEMAGYVAGAVHIIEWHRRRRTGRTQGCTARDERAPLPAAPPT